MSLSSFDGLESGWYLTERRIGAQFIKTAFYIVEGRCPGFVDHATDFHQWMDDHNNFIDWRPQGNLMCRTYMGQTLAKNILESQGWFCDSFGYGDTLKPFVPLRLTKPHIWEHLLEID